MINIFLRDVKFYFNQFRDEHILTERRTKRKAFSYVPENPS